MSRASRWRRILSVAIALISPLSGCASDPSSSGYIMCQEYSYHYIRMHETYPLALLCWYTGTNLGSSDDDPQNPSLWYCFLWAETYLEARESITKEQDEHPCPLDAMSYIFQIYSEWQRENTRIYVIHNPVTENDLIYSEEKAIADRETYVFLYETMELEVPDYLL